MTTLVTLYEDFSGGAPGAIPTTENSIFLGPQSGESSVPPRFTAAGGRDGTQALVSVEPALAGFPFRDPTISVPYSHPVPLPTTLEELYDILVWSGSYTGTIEEFAALLVEAFGSVETGVAEYAPFVVDLGVRVVGFEMWMRWAPEYAWTYPMPSTYTFPAPITAEFGVGFSEGTGDEVYPGRWNAADRDAAGTVIGDGFFPADLQPDEWYVWRGSDTGLSADWTAIDGPLTGVGPASMVQESTGTRLDVNTTISSTVFMWSHIFAPVAAGVTTPVVPLLIDNVTVVLALYGDDEGPLRYPVRQHPRRDSLGRVAAPHRVYPAPDDLRRVGGIR